MSLVGPFRRFSLQSGLVCYTSVISQSYVRMLGGRVSKIGQFRTAPRGSNRTAERTSPLHLPSGDRAAAKQDSPFEIREPRFGQPVPVLLLGVGLAIVVGINKEQIER